MSETRPTPEPRERSAARTQLDQAQPGAAMTIGRLARLVELSTDTIRFYEEEGLLTPDDKTQAGYRLYGPQAVRRIGFIKHAQHCGMTLSEVRQLLELKADDRSCCSDVRSLAVSKKLQLENKIKTMRAMSQALSELIEICNGGSGSLDACPILGALDSSVASQKPESRRMRSSS